MYDIFEPNKINSHEGEECELTISWHFVAYCPLCGHEPNPGREFPSICPQCHAVWTNVNEYNHPIRRRANASV